MEFHDKVRQLITDLGDSPSEIAAFLEGQGVTGTISSVYKCVIAQYLTQVTGVKVAISIHRYDAGPYKPLSEPTGISVTWGQHSRGTFGTVRIPSPGVGQFAADFDKGRYPHLMVKETE